MPDQIDLTTQIFAGCLRRNQIVGGSFILFVEFYSLSIQFNGYTSDEMDWENPKTQETRNEKNETKWKNLSLFYDIEAFKITAKQILSLFNDNENKTKNLFVIFSTH